MGRSTPAICRACLRHVEPTATRCPACDAELTPVRVVYAKPEPHDRDAEDAWNGRQRERPDDGERWTPRKASRWDR